MMPAAAHSLTIYASPAYFHQKSENYRFFRAQVKIHIICEASRSISGVRQTRPYGQTYHEYL